MNARAGSLSARLTYWHNTLAMLGDRPLAGVGAGNWKVVYPRYASARRVDSLFSRTNAALNAHDDYVQVAAELGAVPYEQPHPAGVVAKVSADATQAARLPWPTRHQPPARARRAMPLSAMSRRICAPSKTMRAAHS